MNKSLVYWLVVIAMAVPSVGARAEEVRLPYKGLTLNADLQMVDGKPPAEGVLVIVHGGLSHRDSETIAYLRDLLNEKGHSTLAINLSLALNDRHGAYPCDVPHRHRYADAADEVGAWVAWLKRRGIRHIAIVGHSRGGAQTAVYVAERPDKAVKAAVLLAPATRANSDAADYQRRANRPLAPTLARAQALIKSGRGDALLRNVTLLSCANASATAHSLVSYYGPDPRLDTPHLLPKISVPTLVVVAGNDEIVVGLGAKLEPLVDGNRIRMVTVASADHFFRDLYTDDAVDNIDAFLRDIGF